MLFLPVFQDKSSKFTQEIELGGRLLTIYIYWNSRAGDGAWFMNITDKDTDEKLLGTKLVPNWLLLRQYRYTLPAFTGDFIVRVTDSELAGAEITYDNLGNGWDLYYVTLDEGEEWEDFYGIG